MNINSQHIQHDEVGDTWNYTEQKYLYFSNGNGQPRGPALCQLYRHTFFPYRLRWYVVLRAMVGDSCSKGQLQIRRNRSINVGCWLHGKGVRRPVNQLSVYAKIAEND